MNYKSPYVMRAIQPQFNTDHFQNYLLQLFNILIFLIGQSQFFCGFCEQDQNLQSRQATLQETIKNNRSRTMTINNSEPPNQFADKLTFQQSLWSNNSTLIYYKDFEELALRVRCPLICRKECQNISQEWIFTGCKHKCFLNKKGKIFCKENGKDCRTCQLQNLKFCCGQYKTKIIDWLNFLQEVNISLQKEESNIPSQRLQFYVTLTKTVEELQIDNSNTFTEELLITHQQFSQNGNLKQQLFSKEIPLKYHTIQYPL